MCEEMCEGWIKDFATPYYAPSYKIKNILYERQSEYQNIKIVESYQFGRMLLLDDIVQLSEIDEFIYHEMLVNIALLTHPNPVSVYIVGGGDGCTLREVLRHPVEKVTMVELDKDVVSTCEKYLDVAKNLYSDRRVNLIFDEAAITLQNSKEHYDIILVDSTDPIGEAVKLFTTQFYQNAAEHLNEDGLIVTQSGSPIFQPTMIQRIVNNMKAVFPIVQVYTAIIPTYPGIYWSFTIGSKMFRLDEIKIEEIEKRINERKLNFKYYNSKIHQACFILPEFVKSIISNESPYGIFKSKDLIWNFKNE
ncbi:MAG: polyamine aminopropyltransferase [bacterium]